MTLAQLEGGAELCAWFEAVPSLHDAKLTELELRQNAPSRLVAHTFKMGSQVGSNGFFLLTEHAVVTLTMFDLISVELHDFNESGIMFGLKIESDAVGTTLSFDSSYSVYGRIKAKRVTV